MEIKIKNKIKVGDQTEIIEEIHTCEVMEKGDFTYLVHHNSEKEKVVIKLNQDELVMTRFSNPKSIMRFSAKVPASNEIAYDETLLLTMENALNKSGIEHIRTKVWTTDAFYRETAAKVKRRLEAGAKVVDMESSAIMA